MVIRKKSRSRKYLGARSWGAGNIKNRRGAGSRGGTGKGGIKHKFTRTIVYEKYRIGKTGFKQWGSAKLKEISLDSISEMAHGLDSNTKSIELKGYKVLSSGKLSMPITIKADAFSKKAVEKIKGSGGEALEL